MPKRTSADKTTVRVVIVTLDSHIAGAIDRATAKLRRDLPGIQLSLHAAAKWAQDADALKRCLDDIAKADIILATMLFLEDHINAVLPALQARRDDCDAIVACMSAGEVIRLTRLGRFNMGAKETGAISWLKRLRGSRSDKKSSGHGQMAMLRRLPRILRFIPGTAQDVRAFFLTMQYWLACSDDNLANMVRLLVGRYAKGPRAHLKGTLKARPPADYPDVGLYHPAMAARISEKLSDLPKRRKGARGTIGLLLMRSYVLAGDSGHYDGVIGTLEARGYDVVPAFASGLDARPAVEAYFMANGRPKVDAVVSLTGFSLVGGPAYNDAKAAEEMLASLDLPYIAAHSLEFQTLNQWRDSERGLMPVEATMMVAIPELDGAISPMVYGGRNAGDDRSMRCDLERAELLAGRVDRLVTLRKTPPEERRLAIVLYNFPPNAGATGTAAFLSVFTSLHHTLEALAAEGYQVDVPADVDALRERILIGNAARFGADANVHDLVSANDYIEHEPHLEEIEKQWGPAPGKHQSNGSAILVLGAQFGNVFVGLQPTFGYEGDPMRLLFEKGFTPTHAFSAFYRYLRKDLAAHAVLHFGTHGALEFMPGKQAGMSASCWPDRLIRDLPHFYLYAANNPSEATIAKRRSGATLISYLTPPLAKAGLYRGLLELKSSLERWRTMPPDQAEKLPELGRLIQAQAANLDLAPAEPEWDSEAEHEIGKLSGAILEMEYALIPHGLHIVGEPISLEERVDMLSSMADAAGELRPNAASVAALAGGAEASEAMALSGLARGEDAAELFEMLATANRHLSEDTEMPALMRALDGRFIRPVPGGDLLRSPAILPTGRNLHGFDPFRIPSAFAVDEGKRQADRLLARHMADNGSLPESIAMVLWGTDNLKSEGGPISQALALLGAVPRFDSFGRLTGSELLPLETLGRPRIDVVMTLSGIFRDLLPLQIKLLAEAAFLAASADEPVEQNFVRKHALAYAGEHGCDLETAAMRVFSNADGSYGSNVNHLIDSGRWSDEAELGETYTRRKCFAYGRSGPPVAQADLLKRMLADVNLTYQNLESVELGVTTIDHYFDTLGGISSAVAQAKSEAVPVYIGDETHGEGRVRTLAEQVALETRTRMLNPKWYEAMLGHGYEGVRQIEAHVTNTMGWSATTGQVAPWVYQKLTDTFVLDEEMRKRLAELNPIASSRVANRLIEAQERDYWTPDEETLEALRRAGEELEDQLEGITVETAA